MENSSQTPTTPEDEQGRNAEGRQLVVRPTYEVFIFGLTVLQLVNSILLVVLPLGDEWTLVLSFFIGIAAVLIVDAVMRLRAVPRRMHWLRKLWGWMIIVGSIPIPFAVIIRLWRTRLFLSRMKNSDLQLAMGVAVHQRAGGILLLAVLAAVVVLEVGSLLVLNAEQYAPNANILTGGDAVWWALVTVATVGYGDKYPVTPVGRSIGVLVMVVGVGLFSVLTSFLAQNFVRAREEHSVELVEEVEQASGIELEDDLTVIRRLLDEQEATMAELRTRVHRLEEKRKKK